MSAVVGNAGSPDAGPDGETGLRLELERLRAEVRTRDEFLALTAHELRNPLQSMSLQLAVIHTLAESQGNAALAARIVKTQVSLRRYVDRVTVLLDIASAGQSSLPVKTEIFDLQALLVQVAGALSPEGQFHGMSVKVLYGEPCTARSNRLLLEQVIENLVINAFKHAGGTEVALSVHVERGLAEIRVSDDGMGIGGKDRERIFDRFSVAESSRRGTGSGLGLWIVRRLLDRLGGTVALLPGGPGSTFQVLLPLAHSPEVPS
jgi:two-component system OmpR family sensor kinase